MTDDLPGLLLQNTVDKLVQRANASFLVSTSSWKEQFVDAITVSAGESGLLSIAVSRELLD